MCAMSVWHPSTLLQMHSLTARSHTPLLAAEGAEYAIFK